MGATLRRPRALLVKLQMLGANMRRQRAVEKLYSVRETAFLLGYEASWVRKNVARFAAYGPVYKPAQENSSGDSRGPDYRISASAINGLLDAGLIRSVGEVLDPGEPAKT